MIKLSKKDVTKIYELYHQGESSLSIAKTFGVDRTTIYYHLHKKGLHPKIKTKIPENVIRRIVEDYKNDDPLHNKAYHPNGKNPGDVWTIPTQPFPGSHFAVFPEKLIEPIIKASSPPDGVVLDPFAGSGTALRVARKLGRNFIGIELNPEYAKMARQRVRGRSFKRDLDNVVKLTEVFDDE